jgi:hypothetical protein
MVNVCGSPFLQQPVFFLYFVDVELLVARRLPVGLGMFLFQGIERNLTSGAPPTAFVVSGVVDLQEGRDVILLFVWTFL